MYSWPSPQITEQLAPKPLNNKRQACEELGEAATTEGGETERRRGQQRYEQADVCGHQTENHF